jgi:membrane protease subunit HflK
MGTKKEIFMAWDWEKLQQKRGGSGGVPPQMVEVLDKLREVKGKYPGAMIVIIAVVILILGSSMFYTIGVDEAGVVQRFGKYHRTTSSGLNFKLPTGIEKVTKVRVATLRRESFGFRTAQPGIRSRFGSGAAYLSESLMLTGDLNVAVVPWIVQYRIKDPKDWLFKVADVRATLRDLSEATMRLVVGDRSISEVISKRGEIADQAKLLLQKELDEAETGISVTTIEMQKTNVPEPVQSSFNEVNQAIQEKEKMVYQAREAYNKIIPQARGDAEKTIKSADGYAMDRVNRAKGDASRFISL